MYLRHYDERFGDLYEVYASDDTGEFQGALRSLDDIGRNTIYYDRLVDIPPVARNAIEHLVSESWQKKQKEVGT
jgi:hypothetical protein